MLGSCNQNATGARLAQAAQKQPLTASLVAYPNPFTTTANLEIRLAASGVYKAELIDMKGRLVQIIASEAGEAGKTYGYELNSETLPSGIYLVKLVTPSEVKFLKLALEK
jgi:hypothetical protein